MDDLAHQPELRFHLFRLPSEPPHIIKIQHIRTVQTDAINIKSADPETDYIHQRIHNRRVLQIQPRKLRISPPGLIRKRISQRTCSVKIHLAIPVFSPGIPLLLLKILKGRKFTARMVKNTVNNHLDSLLMAGCHPLSEAFVISQPAVNPPVIPGIIAMGGGLKQGPDIDAGKPQIFHMVNPFISYGKHRPLFFLKKGPGIIRFRRPAKSQGIHMIKNTIFKQH